MRTSGIVRITVVLAIVMLIGVLFWHGRLGHIFVDRTGRLAAPLVVWLHRTSGFIGTVTRRGDLAHENADLRDQIVRAQADAARLVTLEEENNFLRAALEMKKERTFQPISASVFSYIREGGIREMIVNRGSRDGMSGGDIVITAQGALVGTVLQVFDRHAVVRAIDDPLSEVTARLLGSDISGLVHWDIKRGLILDLVQKDEHVSEGQVVVTSGNDQFPAGLIIGSIRSVDNESATLFKAVSIAPTIRDHFNGRVLVIRQ